MELKRINWYNKEAFTAFFEGVYEDVWNLYEKVQRKGVFEENGLNVWIEENGEKSNYLCICKKEQDVLYTYLFIVEKFPFGEFITNAHRVYRDWDTDFENLEKKELIERFDHYNQYTNNVTEKESYGISKPNLVYFKENEEKILPNSHFLSESLLFQFNTFSHELFEKNPDLKEILNNLTKEQILAKKPPVTVNGEHFFYMAADIIRICDIVQNLVGKENNFTTRAEKLEKEVASFVNQELFFTGYEVADLVRKCEKKKARSKKTAVETNYAKAWITTKGKKKTLVIDYCNWRDYTYAFSIHEIKGDYAYFSCYRVFQEWNENKEKFETKWLVETMDDYLENIADEKNKPTLSLLLKETERFEPIFSFHERIEENSVYHHANEEVGVQFVVSPFYLRGESIEHAIGMIERFENM